MRDIALATDVHYSTVSLALRGDTRIKIETRERIKSAAYSLGYAPDPILSALSSYRGANQPARYHSTLAWVTNGATRNGWKTPAAEQCFQGARERAAVYGYRLEEFWLRDPNLGLGRASQILRARNIVGLVITPQLVFGSTLDLEWDHFSVVAIGYNLGTPKLHMVDTDEFSSMKLATEQVIARGHRRLGLVMIYDAEKRANQNWLGGYLVKQREFQPQRRLPPLLLSRWDVPAVAKWLTQARPDCIITRHPEVFSTLRRLGRNVPRDISVVLVRLSTTEGNHAGVTSSPSEVGAGAIGFLADMIRRHERGLPLVPQCLLFNGHWIDGKSLASAGAVPRLKFPASSEPAALSKSTLLPLPHPNPTMPLPGKHFPPQIQFPSNQ